MRGSAAMRVRPGMRGVGGASLLPPSATSVLAQLSGATLWLDERGLTTATGYSAWADQSAGAHTLSQGVGASQPAAGATINGYAAPDFDGTNDTLVSAAAANTFITTTAWHAWCVLQVDAISTNDATPVNNDAALGTSLNAAWGPFYFRDAGAAPKFSAWQYDGAYKTPTLIDIPTGSPILLEASYDGTNIRARYLSTENAAVAGSISLGITGTVAMGRAQGAGTFLDGKIAAMIVCNAHQSASVIATVRAFLASKYGVAA